jgi:hypothetical protein
MRIKFARSRVYLLLRIILPPALVTGFFFFTSGNTVSFVQFSLALLLMQIPWTLYIRWKKDTEEVLPLAAIITFMYWLYYAVPLFWTDRIVDDRSVPMGREISEAAITFTLLLAALGVSALLLGMELSKRSIKMKGSSTISLKTRNMNYVRLLLVAVSLLGLSDALPLMLGAGGRQGIAILVTAVPTTAFVILLGSYLKDEATLLDKFLVVFFLGLRLITGLASGWLGSFASLIIICAFVYLAQFRKLPRIVTITAVVFILFFQPGKNEFRRLYWGSQVAPASKLERVTFWTETSINKWSEVLSNPNPDSIREALNPSVARVSLLSQAANIIELTPSVVPYQYGQLYSYMVITWIPRFLWPNKPSMNDANRFYQTAYGLSSEDELEGVSIGAGVLAEGFISFGWWGAIGIMFLLGIVLDIYRRFLLSRSSGVFMVAMGIVLLPTMLALELQMAAYLGGILQQVVFTMIIFFPALKFLRPRLSAAAQIPRRSYSFGYRR